MNKITIRLGCRIFGHKFVRKAYKEETSEYITYWETEKLDWCVKCGLTKNEIKNNGVINIGIPSDSSGA